MRIKCPICEINYMQEGDEMCEVCRKERGLLRTSNDPGSRGAVQIPSAPRLNGVAVFYVFHNETMFVHESKNNFIWAPFSSKGKDPHHWKRLENVRKGDIIFHGMMGCVCAIGAATSNWYEAHNPFQNTPLKGRKVDCEYLYLSHPILTANYKKEIMRLCSNKPYQPFNKNGTGNQGYLFDLDVQLATLFMQEIMKKNPSVMRYEPIKEFLAFQSK